MQTYLLFPGMLAALYSKEKVEDDDYVPTSGFGMDTIEIKKKKIDLWVGIDNRI